ncbi:hypothetical protein EB796_006715 [Bugula neritina]|uniref:Uncharacterized protein n=1 Tax=Bugula neritina TaxID=10212 RepID=A0A7J7K8L2_BUGNE|nr:hypothetical protein EB796_006715 [Bugula neritina]
MGDEKVEEDLMKKDSFISSSEKEETDGCTTSVRTDHLHETREITNLSTNCNLANESCPKAPQLIDVQGFADYATASYQPHLAQIGDSTRTKLQELV